jgi:hypothetical protein
VLKRGALLPIAPVVCRLTLQAIAIWFHTGGTTSKSHRRLPIAGRQMSGHAFWQYSNVLSEWWAGKIVVPATFAVTLNPPNDDARAGRELARLMKGNTAEGLPNIDRALERAPDNLKSVKQQRR